ncbi:hypothetical protein R69749_04670 [Paraburkholderia domus]|uniref:Uncharacterized protein n=1 Tax=Paraburkholderia domus TaxID=2793075 RepID=A0A9N8MVI4_9BURK|nr:hypothetical protein R70006_03033 [Paraburkholderia domus]CAE6819286.1 hypothetical protein R75483_06163 [Paraburkholderia domus]CAE6845725.1 hypothetical protein R69749_04670 [Paraburkholderia domus]CAE6908909.1 hypothetical protein R70211_03778 [Paraburkholderia domus]CAE6919421.1 hypothetical protein R75471_04090 [Paraburkholderia domus]
MNDQVHPIGGRRRAHSDALRFSCENPLTLDYCSVTPLASASQARKLRLKGQYARSIADPAEVTSMPYFRSRKC